MAGLSLTERNKERKSVSNRVSRFSKSGIMSQQAICPNLDPLTFKVFGKTLNFKPTLILMRGTRPFDFLRIHTEFSNVRVNQFSYIQIPDSWLSIVFPRYPPHRL